ncbi:structural maintenance of chromosomes 5 smc5 [Stachybotrys elegans]|uniref:Structural maintenance of chromosomes protein 5 n=1 Tax=Stachybotrys elegans TaxID=80388 RepID=A0A8K0WRC1_9HYPO|nr:structural maintenance of chromosomes 5 smc5 [Stachybotrys elegans]
MVPGLVRRRRRAESDDEDTNLSDADSQQSAGSPKRRRVSRDPETDEEEDQTANTQNPPTAPSSPDEFHPGAIVRVTVENFVTYEKAEFFPGPNLNMVIGPNGTGKSSLVCAICLGLGYSPKHLGRAGSVKEFVKHGKDTATIEIELQKRPKDRSNYVVRVQIRREQNSQKWWLNGKETIQKTIQSLMQALKIQVDNLCQFLPQDRVVEFAACTPIDLLHETLRAAAPQKMLGWQAQLQDLHKDKKSLRETAQSNIETLRNLETRQQGMQADVDRVREREEIQEKVTNLKCALTLAKYEEARRKHSQARERKKAAERALRRLEEESGPSLQAVNQKQIYVQKIEAAVAGREDALKAAEKTARDFARDISTASEAINEFENTLAAERKGFESKKKDIAASRAKITTYQADLKNQPPAFNASDWNQKIRAEEHTMRELEAEQRETGNQIDAIRQKGKDINNEIKQTELSLKSFDTQEGQQLNFMKKHFPELSTAWDWIQEHRGDFEQEVFGPPMISCSLKDERFSDQVQSLLQMDDFTCFTAQNKNDYKRLTDQLYRVMSLSVVVRTCSRPLSAFQPPVRPDEAASLGLDGFALDYLEGPSPVLAMLCAEKRLHQSGVSLNEHSDDAYDRLVKHGAVSQWAAGRHSYIVRRRKEYGPQAMTTVTKNIQKGRFWTSQPVDTQEKEEQMRRFAELRDDKEVLKTEFRQLEAKYSEIDERKSHVYEKIEQLKKEKSGLQKEYQKWQSLPEKIESEEQLKAGHEQGMRDARKRIVEINYEYDTAVIERAKTALQHKKAIDKFKKARQSLLEAKICLIEARSDVNGLKNRNANIMRRLDEERANVQQAIEESNRTREEGTALSHVVRETLPEDEEKRDAITQLAENKTPEDVQLEIDAEAAKLELIHAANPNVIRDFEKRAQEIARLKKKMEESDDKLAGLTRELEEIMSKFEPRLDELVSKINDAFAYNFEQISCAGEVRVHKHEDFDQWALDIMVKFRENETLQQLTAHRQSGGERAVSTIFFLMALQSMAQSPFRVVDEINQGMDPRNERMVHERMVEIACREHTSQYFLITPKLLTGLRYDAKMRVLCIASGEHMPREGRKLDFRRCVKVQRSLMARA